MDDQVDTRILEAAREFARGKMKESWESRILQAKGEVTQRPVSFQGSWFRGTGWVSYVIQEAWNSEMVAFKKDASKVTLSEGASVLADGVVAHMCKWGDNPSGLYEYQSWWAAYLTGPGDGAATMDALNAVPPVSTAGVTKDEEVRRYLRGLWTERLLYLKGEAEDNPRFLPTKASGTTWDPEGFGIGHACARERERFAHYKGIGNGIEIPLDDVNKVACMIAAHIEDYAGKFDPSNFTPPYVPWVNGWVAGTVSGPTDASTAGSRSITSLSTASTAGFSAATFLSPTGSVSGSGYGSAPTPTEGQSARTSTRVDIRSLLDETPPPT
jgi:hypothetical protein